MNATQDLMTNKKSIMLDKADVKLILDQLKDDYIDYENKALHKLLKEMRAWLDEQS